MGKQTGKQGGADQGSGPGRGAGAPSGASGRGGAGRIPAWRVGFPWPHRPQHLAAANDAVNDAANAPVDATNVPRVDAATDAATTRPLMVLRPC